MTPDELVEAVARAISAETSDLLFDDHVQEWRNSIRREARAALRVVREAMAPTLAMRQSAMDRDAETLDTPTIYEGIWRAMLAASALGRIEE